MKRKFYTEAAYICGLIILALGTAFMEKADFGMSMIVAPAYLLHLKISEFLPFFSFGMAEYLFQGLLIVCLSLALRKAKITYPFSLLTAVLYGFTLDLAILSLSYITATGIASRIFCFVFGMLLCSVGVAFFFKTYISPEAYELVVKEVAVKLNMPIGNVKTVYDCSSCLLSIVMSFAFFGFGHFEGIHIGTVICALLNGFLIGKMSILLDKLFDFTDGLKLRAFFEK